MNWSKRKPELNKECLLLTLSYLSNNEVTTRIWVIKEVIVNTEEMGGAYWAILENGDEEWLDYDDLVAEYYMVIDLPESEVEK